MSSGLPRSDYKKLSSRGYHLFYCHLKLPIFTKLNFQRTRKENEQYISKSNEFCSGLMNPTFSNNSKFKNNNDDNYGKMSIFSLYLSLRQ